PWRGGPRGRRWPAWGGPASVVGDAARPGGAGAASPPALRGRGEPMGPVPAIALTAYGSSADRRQLLDAGFQAHVAKPFDPVHLAAVVETTAYAGVLHRGSA